MREMNPTCIGATGIFLSELEALAQVFFRPHQLPLFRHTPIT